MIAILDYGVGNIRSILNMLRKAGVDARTTSSPAEVEQADKLILPGVGAFDHGMARLRASGLLPALTGAVVDERKPLLGICLGMQLLGEHSEEGTEPGLGWLEAESVRFQFGEGAALPVPHMGWSEVAVRRPTPLLDDEGESHRFYFLHSYHLRCRRPSDVIAEGCYGAPFTAIAGQDNVLGVQFHPEKSHRFGLQLLRNFAERF